MKMKFVGTAGMAALTAVAGVALGGALPAHADIYQCPTSTVCVYQNEYYGGVGQTISGFASYTDVNSQEHDQVSSWINACINQPFVIGEWRYGSRYTGEYLAPGWVEDRLGPNAGFNDMADYVAFA
ncbi:hypothetical protein PUN71_021660 [Arthrobacter sp. NQ7]|uniref:peptidase inhibitor family I36 protein n=1 Tax=Arthrobacter sp. NQ7 TaxID=3032303 RepID=UPI002410B4AB|nr:peptidase inhibitor family I36 protein [Arthrobacter sp. NQ7]MDJ0459819.1 hypothetical protein [Arthrobacter sp. NQ7]